MTAPAGWPNSRVAVTDQDVTSPEGSRVNVARLARSGSRRRGSPASPFLAVCDSTGPCTSLDNEPVGVRGGLSRQCPARHFVPRRWGYGRPLPVLFDIVQTRNVYHYGGRGMVAEKPGWVPPGVDVRRANVARAYDYWLGGSHNFGRKP